MNLRKHLTLGLGLAALALALTTVQARAQTVLRGTFDLPAAAYWGDTLLQPGQYTISMSADAMDLAHVPMINLTGEGIHASFLGITKPRVESSRNYLEIAEVNGTYVIRAFDAGILGKKLAFGMTKAVKSKALRASVEPPISVPVYAEAGF